jgi:hypothetical protein
MKKYILGICSLLFVALVLTSSTTITSHERQKPSTLDSLLRLRYNAANHSSVIKAIEKLDKPQSQKLDSAVSFLNALPGCWAMSDVYRNRMNFLTYYQISGFAAVVKQEYELFDKIEGQFPMQLQDDPSMYIVDKPVIYLYPEKEQKISVNLGFDGTELYTWPQIDNKQNWTVTAQPDGMLKDNAGEEYPYLFWEGKMNSYAWVNMNEGFVVEANETETFLRDKLKVLGLNSREYTDFITFWSPRLRKNKFNLIRFETSAYNKEVPLQVSPAPESSQRILMVYKGLEEPISVKEQVLKPFTRKGYTLIEWGGTAMPEIVN